MNSVLNAFANLYFFGRIIPGLLVAAVIIAIVAIVKHNKARQEREMQDAIRTAKQEAFFEERKRRY